MICSQCGNIIREDSSLCPYCGAERGKSSEAAENQGTAGPLCSGREPESGTPGQEAPGADLSKQSSIPRMLSENGLLLQEFPEFELPEQELAQDGERRAERAEGEAVKAAGAAGEEHKKRKKRIRRAAVLTCAAALMFFLLLAAGVRAGSGKGKWKLAGGKDAFFTVWTDTEKIVIAGDGKVLEGSEEFYNLAYPGHTSMDEKKLLVTGRDSRKLYLVTKEEWLPIDRDVTLAAISSSGDGIVYAAEQDGGLGLYLYDVKKQKSKLLTDQLRDVRDLVISADGTSAACLYADGDRRECRLFLSGGEKTEILENIIPIAISSGGDYFYYIKTFITGPELFCLITENGTVQELGEADPLIFNEDMTQMLYNSHFRLYLLKNGEIQERAVLPKAADRVILPDYAQIMYVPKQTMWGDCLVRSCAAETLGGLLCVSGSELYYIRENMDGDRIAACSACQISRDGKSLLYLSSGSLYRVRNLESSLKPEKLADGPDILQFISDDRLECIYYQTRHGELMFLKGNKEPEMLCQEKISSWELLGRKLYFISDSSGQAGTLYMLVNGTEKKAIAEASRLERYGERLYFWAADDSLYTLNDEDKPVLVLESSGETR